MGPRKIIIAQESMPLLDMLANALPGYKRTTLRNILKHGAVSVNGTVVDRANNPVSPGDEVIVTFEQRDTRQRMQGFPLEIVIEDEAIIVINKPPGLLSVPTLRTDENNAYSILNEYLKAGKPRGRAYIVHRIDRETSGLLLFAKSDDLKRSLKDNWKNTEKIYLAIAEGVPARKEDTITSYLAEDKGLYVSSVRPSAEARLSITHYKVIRSAKNRALLEIDLETGRKNQIRVHLAEIGHPIVGDTKYGAITNPAGRLALHAWRLSFDHPLTGQRLDLEAPFPKELETLA